MGKHMTEVQKGQICAFKASGRSRNWIARALQLHNNAVGRVIKKYEAGEHLERKAGSGRPKKTSAHTDRAIVREMKVNRFATAPEIQETLSTIIRGPNGDQTLSDSTIRNRIKETGEFQSYWAARKPFISDENKKKRVEWCLARRHWTIEDWRNVLWSDESPYVLRYAAKRRVWRRHNERYIPECCVATVKHDKKIMVWGCFAAHGVGDLLRVIGIMEQKQYRQILIHHMRPSLRRLFPRNNGIFQQDNDPKHTAKTLKRYLDNPNNRINQFSIVGQHSKPLRWPAQSPDLNPIENLWSILDQQLSKRSPNSEEELYETLQEGWKAIPVQVLTNLVDSMPRRIEAVLAVRGNPTKY
jgi:transposase